MDKMNYVFVDVLLTIPNHVLPDCNDKLNRKDMIPQVVAASALFDAFNFDMLNAAVEEMNRFGETLPEVLEVLNIQPENRAADTFRMELVFNGKNGRNRVNNGELLQRPFKR